MLFEDIFLVKRMGEHLGDTLFRIVADFRRTVSVARKFSKDSLYFSILAPSASLFFEDQVGSHATTSEVFYTLVVFGPVGMRIKVTRAIVAHVFEKLHQPES